MSNSYITGLTCLKENFALGQASSFPGESDIIKSFRELSYVMSIARKNQSMYCYMSLI